jgi:uncharacterized protein (TIGR02444 family)
MNDTPTQTETTPFWRFSLYFYRQPTVSDACIALQDEYGVDVNLLLFLLWLADQGRQLSADEVKKVDEKVRDWRNFTVIPIRNIRRKLRSARTLVVAAEQEVFRTKVKGIELEAERLQQQTLYALSQSGPLGTQADPNAAAHANVCAYEHIMGATFPRGAMDALQGAFKSMTHGEYSTAGGAGEDKGTNG